MAGHGPQPPHCRRPLGARGPQDQLPCECLPELAAGACAPRCGCDPDRAQIKAWRQGGLGRAQEGWAPASRRRPTLES